MSETTNFTSRGQSISAELYKPASTTANGLITVAYGSDGLTDNLSGPWATMIRGWPPGKLAHAQIHHGEADNLPGTGFENAISIEKTLKAEGASPELYGYRHGFVGSDPKNTKARELSMKRTIAFFDSHL